MWNDVETDWPGEPTLTVTAVRQQMAYKQYMWMPAKVKINIAWVDTKSLPILKCAGLLLIGLHLVTTTKSGHITQSACPGWNSLSRVLLTQTALNSFVLNSVFSDERDAIQKKTFTKWVNKHLKKVSFKFSFIFCWNKMNTLSSMIYKLESLAFI